MPAWRRTALPRGRKRRSTVASRSADPRRPAASGSRRRRAPAPVRAACAAVEQGRVEDCLHARTRSPPGALRPSLLGMLLLWCRCEGKASGRQCSRRLQNGRGSALPPCRRGCCFPPVCPGCRRLVSEPGTLCGPCWPKLRFLERPWCDVMGTPFAIDHGTGRPVCRGDRQSAALRPRPRGRGLYRRRARSMVQGLKYPGRHRSRALDGALDGAGRRRTDRRCRSRRSRAAAPRRFLRRRFNQSAELARALAAQTGMPFAPAGARARQADAPAGGACAPASAQSNVRAAFGCRCRGGSGRAAGASCSSTTSNDGRDRVVGCRGR